MNKVITIEGRHAVEMPDAAAPARFMYMPAGTHEIDAAVAGTPTRIRVIVDHETVTALNNALTENRRSSGNEPFFDFNHQGMAASAWPKSFSWQDGPKPGVYVEAEWSQAGREAVAGRVYRSFSPKFLIDQNHRGPARVLGAPLNMGGLVNDPAFRNIRPVTGQHQNIMNEQNGSNANPDPAAQGNAAATAPTPAATQPATVEASSRPQAPETLTTPATPVVVEAAEITALRQQNAQLVEAQRRRTEQDADAAIAQAIERGAIPPQAREVQAQWRQTILANPSALVLLAGMGAVTSALQPGLVTASREITREDSRRVVEAYHRSATPIEKGRLWQRDIRQRLKDGDTRVVEAANALGTVSGELIVQQSLDLLRLNFPMLSKISTDFSGENAGFNQTVKTRIRALPAVASYAPAGAGYATQDAVATDVPVLINQHKFTQVAFNANELASTNRGLLDEQADPMQAALGEAIMTDLYAIITAGNFANFTLQAVGGFGRATMVATAKKLSGVARKVPQQGRVALLNGDYFEKLLTDANILNLAAYQNREIITENRLPSVAGFEPIEAPNLPTTGNLAGFCLTPAAMCLAARTPADYSKALPGANGGGVTSVITNPDTGLSVQLVQFIDHMAGRAIARVALMYGFAVGNAVCGERITSA